jgi:hypothetical protein
MGYYDAIDLDWDTNGDFVIGEDGDLKDTSDDYIKAKEHQIFAVLRNQKGDYRSYPAFACSLEDYVGEPNTKETGIAIENRIKNTIIFNNIAAPDDIYVRVIPVRPDAILINGSVSIVPTPFNRLDESGDVSFSFIFNLPSGQIISMIPEITTNFNPIGK